MAKKKKKDGGGGGTANWMNTFADLMNLLLCFFVLLFSMSSVDADKFEALVQSLEHSFSILPQGGSSIGDGQMVAAGVNQLQLLDQYYKEAANSSSEEEGEDNEQEDTEQALKEEMTEAGLKESEEMAEQIEKMLEEQRIGDQVEVDANAQFVRLTLNGALLFDSGQSQIREDALTLVDKLSLIFGKLRQQSN